MNLTETLILKRLKDSPAFERYEFSVYGHDRFEVVLKQVCNRVVLKIVLLTRNTPLAYS